MDPRLWPYVETIWNYHRLGQSVGPAGAILVLCSHDTIVAERGAQLWLDGLAPRLVFSGGLGAITRHLWTEPEAERFARIAEEMGVPRERMLLETESTNTGENVLFTRRLLERKGIDVERLLVVQKPYMERRSWATFKKVWPEKEITVTSPQLSLDEYLARGSNEALPPDEAIAIMVGDLQRIHVYPERGFQIPQEIPGDVWEAYEALVAAGYDRHLIR